MGDTDKHRVLTAAERPQVRLRSSTNIQGNILAPFNKDHQAFLFLSFEQRAKDGNLAGDAARRWLYELTDPSHTHIASTRRVTAFNDEFSYERRRLDGRDPPYLKAVWVNVGLTFSGLCTLRPQLAGDLQQFAAFCRGPAGDGTAALLGDNGESAPEHWVVGGQQPMPDALVTVAADREDELMARVHEERDRAVSARLSVLRVEYGRNLRDASGRAIEHFGFRDGVSQPGIRGFSYPAFRPGGKEDADQPGSALIAAGEFVLGHLTEQAARGQAPPRIPSWMRDGSFQVFRRLTQDVACWHEEMRRLQGPLPSADALAAKMVGRNPDGTPLSPRDRPRGPNDFDYADDPFGYRTPRFAHVRKVNPRTDKANDRAHRLLRRGIPFGPRYDPSAGATDADVERGLLFNAYVASIEDQFEFVQRSWANQLRFPSFLLDADNAQVVDGPDPIIGVRGRPCFLRAEDKPAQELDFRRFVRTTGAAYAFAPSIRTLRWLAGRT
jgi:Dyp-type peroxidase family